MDREIKFRAWYGQHDVPQMVPYEVPQPAGMTVMQFTGLKDKNGWHGPKDFHRMSIGWYLNHSYAPNVAHKHYKYYSLRRIRAGEELTINYESL